VRFVLFALVTAAHATDTRKSGFEFMQPSTRALQKDDTQNPAMLWVKDGQALWNKPEGVTAKSCASCHGEISRMKSVATRYPAYSSTQKKVFNLSQQINLCRVTQQQAPAWPAEHESLLGLEAAIAKESRNLPIAPAAQPQLADAQKRGEALFNLRIGQVDLSCRDCHDTLAGKKLGGNIIPQGHATGYPIYRLEWQSVGSLQRRLRGCMTAVRAEPYAIGASELVDLEAYLAKRAAGMTLESPGVRP
jgi:L-cysteine S-thiosulfotransferase